MVGSSLAPVPEGLLADLYASGSDELSREIGT